MEVSGDEDGWFESIPGVRLAERLAGGVVLELEDGTDHQRVLDLARSVGEVHFSMVRPTLSQLFREVVSS